jgi:hypothetical protein
VRYWHKADVSLLNVNVCLSAQSGPDARAHSSAASWSMESTIGRLKDKTAKLSTAVAGVGKLL